MTAGDATSGAFSLSPACQAFLQYVNHQFLAPLAPQNLLSLSSALHKSYVSAASTSPSQMLPSHITTLPSGRERGQYLAVDLGGTNMRVALVRLHDNEATVEKLDKRLIPESVKTGTAREFFAWIARGIVDLARKCRLDEGEFEWKLGVTWSFPFAQNAVNRGTIHKMGKGFNIPSIVNAPLNDLLHEALESLKPPRPIRIIALLNDAVATLLSHAFTRTMTRMGLICGTGTNATCLCPTQHLSEEKYHHENGSGAWEDFVVVNTEWSMFGRGVLPVTKYDIIVDKESGMPGFQPFEMMVSGRYIGEIVRLVCLDGIENGAWSFQSVPRGWDQKFGLQTRTCSMIEAYFSPILIFANFTSAKSSTEVIKLLNSIHPLMSHESYTCADAFLFTQISVAVSTRSASLVATSTLALLQVNDELTKIPVVRDNSTWTSGSSTGTPSPSDSGLGSMDEEYRWSRRGSLFSAQGAGSRRESLVTSKSLSEGLGPDLASASRILKEGVVMEDPSEFLDEEEDDTVVVAFCGSVMEKYYTFRSRCQGILDDLVMQPWPARKNGRTKDAIEQRRVVLEENCDGGILGAGILAAVIDGKELSASIAAAQQ